MLRNNARDSISHFNASAKSREISGTGNTQQPATYKTGYRTASAGLLCGHDMCPTADLLSEYVPPYRRRFVVQEMADTPAGDPLEHSSRPSSERSASGQMVT